METSDTFVGRVTTQAGLRIAALPIKGRMKQRLAPWLFLSPALLYAAIFFVLPLALALTLAFTNFQAFAPHHFTGLRNFSYLLTRDPFFLTTIRNTLVFAVGSRHRLALVGLALRTLAGRADPEQDFAACGECAVLRVEGRSRHIDVALDGEVVRLAMPLTFRSDPGALTVAAPPVGA